MKKWHANHGRDHRADGPDPIPCLTSPPLPAFRALRSSNFTVTDGAYYALAQTSGADPSATGVASTFEFFNDAGDGTGVFNTKPVGTGDVLKLMESTTGGSSVYMLAYDAGVVFTSSIDTTTVTVTLYLGRGTGGGTYSWEAETLEAVMASNVSGVASPTVRLTGTIPVTGGYIDGVSGTDLADTPTISPILLVEGGTPTVDFMWCYFTSLSVLTPN